MKKIIMASLFAPIILVASNKQSQAQGFDNQSDYNVPPPILPVLSIPPVPLVSPMSQMQF